MTLIKRNTAYSLNDIVNTKYGIKLKCTAAGTTSTDPLILDGTSPITDGTVVWEVIEQGGGRIEYSQVTKNVTTANEEIEIEVYENTNFNRAPIEILKQQASSSGVTSTLCDFIDTDSSKFNYVDNVEFDGSAHLQTNFNLTMSTPTALGEGYVSESDEIDISKFNVIEGVDV